MLSYKGVRRILDGNLDTLEIEDEDKHESASTHENVRGGEYYE